MPRGDVRWHGAGARGVGIAQRWRAWRRALRHRGRFCTFCERALSVAEARRWLDLCPECGHWLPLLQHPHVVSLCLHCGREHGDRSFPGRHHGTGDRPDPGMTRSVARRPACACERLPSQYGRIVAAGRYDWPLDHLLRALKYRGQRRLAAPLGTVLADAVRADRARRPAALPEMQLPVPPDRTRVRTRGFDHAADIAAACAASLGASWRGGLAERLVETGAQVARDRAARAEAIRGAFIVSDEVAERHIAIVDDVLTTGATAGEFARELHDSGAASIELWVVARTVAPAADAGVSNTSRRMAGGSAVTV